MSVRKRVAAWSACGSMLLALPHQGTATEVASHFALQPGSQHVEPEQTAAITLGVLSVKPSAMDRPWHPRVCVGCDRNNAPSPDHRRVQLVR